MFPLNNEELPPPVFTCFYLTMKISPLVSSFFLLNNEELPTPISNMFPLNNEEIPPSPACFYLTMKNPPVSSMFPLNNEELASSPLSSMFLKRKVLLLPNCHLSHSLCHLYHLTPLAAICLNNTVIVVLSHCNTTISILAMYVSSRRRDTQHRTNIQSNSWVKYDINEKISSGRLLLLNILTICPKQFLVLLIFSHQ